LVYGCWPLWWLPFFGLRLLAIVMFAFLWITAFGHCDVCLSLVYSFWLSIWYLQTFLSQWSWKYERTI
jgi:hypothetical protein